MPEPPDQLRSPDGTQVLVRSPDTDEQKKKEATTWLEEKLDTLQYWAAGRAWYLYVPLALWMGYVAIRTLQDADYRSFIEGLNLGVHETGHLLFFWAGQDLMVAGGTIAQLIAPLIIMGQLFRQKEYFGMLFCLTWLGTSLSGVAGYMADARAQILPMVSYAPGPGIHDWEYLFSHAGLLEHDTAIAAVVRTGGIIVLIAAALSGAYLVWEMFIQRVLKTDSKV